MSRAKNELNLTDEGLALWTYGSFDTIQKYRGIIERSAAFVNTGIHTLEQAVERASHEILTEGLKTTMTSKSGRRIPVDSYIRGVLKTNLGRTMDEVRKEHMEEYGMHHVVVGSLVGAREACSKIQGQVVDLRPMDEIPEGSEYRSIYDPYWEAHYKEASGHHGINCRHPHFPFIPGVNTNNQPQYDDELNEQVAKDQQKQRSLERQIRNYKKHLKIAQEFGNQEDIDRYTKLISGRQKALREHLDGHKYLSRDYNRERAFDFSTSPPKDIVKPEVPKSKPEPEPRPTIELVEVSDDVVEYFDSKDSDESLEFFQKQFEYTQWKSQLEPLELDSIQEYSEEVYEHTNAYLRTGKGYLDMMTDELGDGGFYAEEVRLTTELIDSGISSYTTQENMKVYRSLQESTVPQEVKDLITNAQPGDRIVPDKSFQSTAVSKKEAIEFGGNILYDIEIPKGLNVGAYIREYSAFSFEDEFLLRPNLEFEVLENNIENGKVIKLRVLGIKE